MSLSHSTIGLGLAGKGWPKKSKLSRQLLHFRCTRTTAMEATVGEAQELKKLRMETDSAKDEMEKLVVSVCVPGDAKVLVSGAEKKYK